MKISKFSGRAARPGRQPRPVRPTGLAVARLPHPRLGDHDRPAHPAHGRPGQVPCPASAAGPGDRHVRLTPGAWPDGPARSSSPAPWRLRSSAGGGAGHASFSRFIGQPVRGKWRAWHYQRHWLAVLTISRLAPVYRGRLLVPVLGKVSSTRYTDRVQVGIVSGQAVADFAAGRRTWRTDSARCCAGSAPHGPAPWSWSSSAATPWPPSSPPCPHLARRVESAARSAAVRTDRPG